MKNTLISIIILLCFFVRTLQASEIEDYKMLSQLPIKELYDKGSQAEKTQTDTALKYFTLATSKYSETLPDTDKYFCALAYSKISELLFWNSNYQAAFEKALDGLRICEHNNFENLLPRFYKVLGNVYDVFGDSKLSIVYYDKGLELAQKHNLKEIEARLLSNLCMTYTTENDFKQARHYYNLMTAHPFQDSLMTYFKHFNIAFIKAYEKKNREAITEFKASLKDALNDNLSPLYISPLYGNIGELYTLEGKQDSALHYLLINEKYTKTHNLSHFHIVTLRTLSDYYETIKDYRKANQYRKRYFEYSDSVINQQKYKELRNARIIYELNKNNQQIMQLAEEKKQQEEQVVRQRRMTLLIGIGLIAAICVTIFIYRQKKKLQATYLELYKRNNTMIQSEIPLENLSDSIDDADSIEEPSEQTPPNVIEEKTEQEDNGTLKQKFDTQQRSELLAQIKHLMEETTEYCDCDFSLERMATAVGSNSKYVSQIINETYHKNFRTFVNEYRIKRACLLLSNTEEYGNYTIQAIGECVGYKSRSNFTEIFKKHTGLPPTIYQQIAKSESQKSVN